MINKDMTIKEIITKYPKTIEVFNNKGLVGFNNELILNKVGINKLSLILEKKNLNINEFVNQLNKSIEIKKENKNALRVEGLLPCPVRIPIMESLEDNFKEDFNFKLEAASMGLDWLKESVLNTNDEKELADIYISAGFDLFFEDHLMKKFKKKKVFGDYSNVVYNKDFNNEQVNLKDPDNDYSMIAVVPAVFLVNENALDGRAMPTKWSDLFNPIYENSVSMPISDFDLFNAILLHLYKDYGLEGIEKLGKSLFKPMHPSEMVKSHTKASKPLISVMPYFFTKMAVPNSPMKAVWPEDGAIISPIFMISKKSKQKELQPFVNHITSKEVGEILSHKGLFPSVNNQVNNNLENKKFKWLGWDFINNNDISKLIKESMAAFKKGRES